MNPHRIVMIAVDYEHQRESPAWQDFFGRLYLIHERIGRDILNGVTVDGEDKTPLYREIFKLLEEIIAIPAIIQARRAWVEEQEYGIDRNA